MSILSLLNEEGFEVESIQLGKIVMKENPSNDYLKLENGLKVLGFELIKEPTEVLIEKIKVKLIQYIEENSTISITAKLEKDIGKSYSVLSKTFSKTQGTTIEKYIINLKIEKAKELIQIKELNFSQIAYSLNYKNSSS